MYYTDSIQAFISYKIFEARPRAFAYDAGSHYGCWFEHKGL